MWSRPKCSTANAKPTGAMPPSYSISFTITMSTDTKERCAPIRVPTLQEQKNRRLCRMRSQMIKVRSIMEGQGRGLMFDFDFHDVPQGWWGPRKWPKLRAKLLEHDPWLIEMLEHHQRLLIAQQRRITNWSVKLRGRVTTTRAKWPRVWEKPPLFLCNAKRLTGSASATKTDRQLHWLLSERIQYRAQPKAGQY